MKVVLLAGGLGTRLSEETALKPKPMVEIGGKPILWHIMKIYSHYGYNDFIICLGYKGYLIKEYFHHYYMHQADMTIDMKENTSVFHNPQSEPWKITLVDTGLNTMTGGRIKRVQHYIGNEPFMLTYGDGVGNIDISRLVDFHNKNKKLATLTAIQHTGKFGALTMSPENEITAFQEKPKGDGSWINGGFFVLEPEIFEYIKKGDETIWEREPLENLVRNRNLNAFKHEDFWQPMDTLRDLKVLDEMWNAGKAPWKVWDD